MAVEVLKQIWPEWQIEGKSLGKGSFGVVYKAVRRDHGVESDAAIKAISIPTDPSEVDSLRSEGLNMNATRTYLQGIVNDFVSEIQLMESLKGVQNIVSVEDYKVVEKTGEIGWDIYIRMELLTPFNAYICDKKLTEKEVIKLGCDICTALEICAKRNIIHRDIKPENIFINDFGDFKLGDFGIARKLENMTVGLSQKGTFNYMAPEVADSSEYDARVDIYSLGIVLYRLLNGNRLPFLDTEKQLLNPNERRNAVDRRLRGEELPAPCDATPAMADLILRACAYDPNMRFASATEMKQALMSVANGTYQIGACNLDRTTSVRKAAGSYDKTTSVRKAPAASNQESASAVNTFGSAPMKKSKVPVVIVSVLAVMILVGAGIFAVPKLFDVSESADHDKSPSGETTSETDDYNMIFGTDDSSRIEDEQIASIISEADALAAEEDYEGALAEVDAGLLSYPESAVLQEKANEYTNALNAQVKAETLDGAKTLADSGDYVSAIELIKNAQETQGDNTDYRFALKTYSDAYKTEVITTADGQAQAGDYLGAFNTVDQAISTIGEDEELASRAKEYEDAYVANVVSQVDTHLENGDFDAADQVVSEALKHFPNNTTMKQQQSRIENSKPQNLLAVCPPYESSGYEERASITMAGTQYTNGFVLDAGYNEAYAIYNLNGKYNTLEFDMGHIDGTQMSNVTFEIYLDGQPVKTIDATAEGLPVHYTIQLDGAKQMKINSTGWFGGYPEYGFVNAVLYPVESYMEQSSQLSSDTFLMAACPPYESSGYEERASITMAGTQYTNGFVLDAGYNEAYAIYNLNGKYNTLEFDMGHIDGTQMSNVTFEIYLDGQPVKTIDATAEGLPVHYTIQLDGAKQMKINSTGWFGGYPEYGFINAVLY